KRYPERAGSFRLPRLVLSQPARPRVSPGGSSGVPSQMRVDVLAEAGPARGHRPGTGERAMSVVPVPWNEPCSHLPSSSGGPARDLTGEPDQQPPIRQRPRSSLEPSRIIGRCSDGTIAAPGEDPPFLNFNCKTIPAVGRPEEPDEPAVTGGDELIPVK